MAYARMHFINRREGGAEAQADQRNGKLSVFHRFTILSMQICQAKEKERQKQFLPLPVCRNVMLQERSRGPEPPRI